MQKEKIIDGMSIIQYSNNEKFLAIHLDILDTEKYRIKKMKNKLENMQIEYEVKDNDRILIKANEIEDILLFGLKEGDKSD